jgi:hypothetical protein
MAACLLSIPAWPTASLTIGDGIGTGRLANGFTNSKISGNTGIG